MNIVERLWEQTRGSSMILPTTRKFNDEQNPFLRLALGILIIFIVVVGHSQACKLNAVNSVELFGGVVQAKVKYEGDCKDASFDVSFFDAGPNLVFSQLNGKKFSTQQRLKLSGINHDIISIPVANGFKEGRFIGVRQINEGNSVGRFYTNGTRLLPLGSASSSQAVVFTEHLGKVLNLGFMSKDGVEGERLVVRNNDQILADLNLTSSEVAHFPSVDAFLRATDGSLADRKIIQVTVDEWRFVFMRLQLGDLEKSDKAKLPYAVEIGGVKFDDVNVSSRDFDKNFQDLVRLMNNYNSDDLGFGGKVPTVGVLQTAQVLYLLGNYWVDENAAYKNLWRFLVDSWSKSRGTVNNQSPAGGGTDLHEVAPGSISINRLLVGWLTGKYSAQGSDKVNLVGGLMRRDLYTKVALPQEKFNGVDAVRFRMVGMTHLFLLNKLGKIESPEFAFDSIQVSGDKTVVLKRNDPSFSKLMANGVWIKPDSKAKSVVLGFDQIYNTETMNESITPFERPWDFRFEVDETSSFSFYKGGRKEVFKGFVSLTPGEIKTIRYEAPIIAGTLRESGLKCYGSCEEGVLVNEKVDGKPDDLLHKMGVTDYEINKLWRGDKLYGYGRQLKFSVDEKTGRGGLERKGMLNVMIGSPIAYQEQEGDGVMKSLSTLFTGWSKKPGTYKLKVNPLLFPDWAKEQKGGVFIAGNSISGGDWENFGETWGGFNCKLGTSSFECEVLDGTLDRAWFDLSKISSGDISVTVKQDGKIVGIQKILVSPSNDSWINDCHFVFDLNGAPYYAFERKPVKMVVDKVRNGKAISACWEGVDFDVSAVNLLNQKDLPNQEIWMSAPPDFQSDPNVPHGYFVTPQLINEPHYYLTSGAVENVFYPRFGGVRRGGNSGCPTCLKAGRTTEIPPWSVGFGMKTVLKSRNHDDVISFSSGVSLPTRHRLIQEYKQHIRYKCKLGYEDVDGKKKCRDNGVGLDSVPGGSAFDFVPEMAEIRAIASGKYYKFSNEKGLKSLFTYRDGSDIPIAVGEPLKVADATIGAMNEKWAEDAFGDDEKSFIDCKDICNTIPVGGDQLDLKNKRIIPKSGNATVATTVLNNLYYLPRITSAYRNPQRNKQTGGSYTSDHQLGGAIDRVLMRDADWYLIDKSTGQKYNGAYSKALLDVFQEDRNMNQVCIDFFTESDKVLKTISVGGVGCNDQCIFEGSKWYKYPADKSIIEGLCRSGGNGNVKFHVGGKLK